MQKVVCRECGVFIYYDTSIRTVKEIVEKSKGKCPLCSNELLLAPQHPEVVPVEKAKVFIVHGTDHAQLKELRDIVENVGLTPIILHEQPNKGMTIIEKLEKNSDVSFAFIILTPDDFGIGKTEFREIVTKVIGCEYTMENVDKFIKIHGEKSLTDKIMNSYKERARQNVILEFGYFIGKLGRSNVCCLYKGDIELPSDMHGVCYLHFTNSIKEIQLAILQELSDREIRFSI